jgi:ElaB/YqjD/DUF883 family membrane-anchored ribosome-binding protein
MPSAQNPSIEDLRKQSELSRANLTATVRELRDRFSDTTTDVQALLSPTRVKEEVKSYARRTGDDFYQRVEDKIRQNPLQAAAIGAGLAYPALSIIRRIPIPLMLLGAGFWLAGRSGQRPQPEDMLSGQGQAAPKRAGRMVTDAPSIVSDLGQQVESHLERTATMASEKVSQTANAASERLSEIAATASQSLSEATTHSQAWAKDTVGRSQKSMNDFVERNPMLVAGLGIGVGALFAAMLPVTRTERKVLRPVQDRVTEGAAAAAAAGMNSLRSAADTKARTFAENLEREGLGAEGLAGKADHLTESAKAVAERGLQAAFGEEPSQPEEVKQGGIGEAQ